jgi:S-DNA-T family DNA segregation ATPase FtsK/SpoIIIE
MQLKLTLQIEGVQRDIVLDAEPTELIGTIASYILQNVGVVWQMKLSTYLSPTLSFLVEGKYLLIPPHTLLRNAEIVDGAIISVTSYLFSNEHLYTTAVYGIIEDMKASTAYPLTETVTIGRSSGSDIQLGNLQISRLQAQVAVNLKRSGTCQIEDLSVADCGSRNGTQYNSATQTIEFVGEQLRVTLFASPIRPVSTPVVTTWYNRNHILPQLIEPKDFELPKEPDAKEPSKLQVMNLAMPLVMCTVLYFVMPNPTTLIFFAMSPLLMLGNWISSKRTVTKQNREQQAKYAKEIENVNQLAQKLRGQEKETLTIRYADFYKVPLWSKHQHTEDFSVVRCGISSVESRVTIDGETIEFENAPYTVNLHTGVGIFGNSEQLYKCVNGLLLQILRNYSPSDLKLSVMLGKSNSQLNWLKWAQNADSDLCAVNDKSVENVLHKLEQIVSQRLNKRTNSTTTVNELQFERILIVVSAISDQHFSRLEQVIRRGKDCEIYCLWIGEYEDDISYQTSLRLEISGPQQLRVQSVVSGETQIVNQYFSAEIGTCHQFVKSIAAVRDLSQIVNKNVLIPNYLEYHQLLKYDILNSESVILTNWADESQVLFAPLGQVSNQVCALNLRQDGPHALVGGTTGAGKSEFLQTWISAMAIHTSPKRLNFLLIDYKGGSAFSQCVKFPHTVGLVTDLSKQLAKRVMISLSAEIKRRELILAKYNAKDLLTLEKMSSDNCPPSLVIVVDEFAALANEIPEFVDELVDVAARGRSLGIHLVMATQRPSGVIKDNLKANTNLRIALRVADENESKDIIGSELAAKINRDTPGRFYYKIDTNSPVEAQSAYVGYKVNNNSSRVTVHDFELGQLTKWETETNCSPSGEEFLKLLAQQLQYAYLSSGIAAPRRPWCEPLPQQLTMNWQNPALGLIDLPHNQLQTDLKFDNNNWLITGSSSCGKTTAVETFVACAINSKRFEHIVILNAMKSKYCEQVSQVAQIVELEDLEKIWRLLQEIRVNSSPQNITTTTDLPTNYCLIIDGIDIFKDHCENSGDYHILNDFVAVLSNSNALNTQIIGTQSRVGGIYHSWLSSFTQSILLALTSDNDYNIAGIPADAIPQVKVPGRGLFGTNEIQLYQVQWDKFALEQLNLPRICGCDGKEVWATAVPIPVLEPHYLASSELIAKQFVGIEANALTPVQLEPSSGTIFVVGPPKSGKSAVAQLVAKVLNQRAATAESGQNSKTVTERSVRTITGQCDDSEVARIVDSGDVVEVPLYLLSNNWNLAAKVKQANTVILLRTTASDAISVVNAHYPNLPYVPGGYARGYLIQYNQAQLVQFFS